ncbi:Fc.00g084970.m01.CDS01 [Cosmosporella sp. VM-42]
MAFRITILPASTKAGKETIRALLNGASIPFIRGVYRDTSKAPAEFTNHPNFEAVEGDVSAGTGLDFSGSHAVFYVPPPTYDGTNQSEHATKTAHNVKKALLNAPSVKKLLLFSSMGAQYDHNIGILRLNHISDAILKDAVPEVLVAKAGYFQENWVHAFATVQADPPVIYSTITPLDHKIPMVSIRDVGEICAQKLLDTETKASPLFFDLFGPRHYNAHDVKAAVEEVTNKKAELVAVEQNQLTEFYGQQIPAAHVQDMVEMTIAALPGGIMAGDFEREVNVVKGKIELVDALRRISEAT